MEKKFTKKHKTSGANSWMSAWFFRIGKACMRQAGRQNSDAGPSWPLGVADGELQICK